MPRYYHVTSTLNRDSIRRHGLDWSRMGAATGIAGSTRPEVEGVYVDEFPDFFVRMNNTGGTVDVWAVDDLEPDELVLGPNGFPYVARVIGPSQLTLLATDLPAMSDLPAGEH